MKSDPQQWLFAGLLVFSIGLFVWFLSSHASVPETSSEVKITDPGRAPTRLSCGQIVRQCRAVAEIQIESDSGGSCNEERGRNQLNGLFGNPLELPGCQEVMKELEENCPTGCHLLPASRMIIPGQVKLRKMRKADESGKCLLGGDLDVSVRGQCIQPSSTPLPAE